MPGFYYFNNSDVIINGINAVHFLTLVGIAAAATAIAVWKFDRRDLSN